MWYNTVMKVRAYGKINLSLYITGRRGSLHTLDSVMATVSVYDELTVCPSDVVRVTCGMDIRAEDNSAYRAAKLVELASGLKLDVKIRKGIPVGGGMGGSSADGAAVLFCARELIGLREEDMREMSAKIGSDVYFMTKGGICRVTGTGDEIEPIDGASDFSALITECGGVGTAECYRAFDKTGRSGENRNDELISLLTRGGAIDDNLLHNDLFAAARTLNPRIAQAEEIINSSGAKPCLTGSGGCLFVISPPDGLAARLTAAGFNNRLAAFAPEGVEIIDRSPTARQ